MTDNDASPADITLAIDELEVTYPIKIAAQAQITRSTEWWGVGRLSWLNADDAAALLVEHVKKCPGLVRDAAPGTSQQWRALVLIASRDAALCQTFDQDAQ